MRPQHLHNLQRTAGNRAIARLLQPADSGNKVPRTMARPGPGLDAGPTVDPRAESSYRSNPGIDQASAVGSSDDDPRSSVAAWSSPVHVDRLVLSSPGTVAIPVQRSLLGIPDFAAETLADVARNVPGYTLMTVVIGTEPITGRSVARTPENLLGGLMGLVPFGTAIYDQLVELGIVQRSFDFVRGELARFDLSLERLGRVLEAVWNEISITNSLSTNVGIAERHLGQLLGDVESFASSLVDAVLAFVREAAIGVAERHLADSPAWALIKKVLHHDPLRDEPVVATTAEIIEDFLKLIGKEQELQQMRDRGLVAQAAAWIDTQLGRFAALLGQLRDLFDAAWTAIQPENIADLGTNLRQLATRVQGFLSDVWAFASDVALQILQLVKDAVLAALDKYSHEIPGYQLLTVILERNPVTDAPVEQTPQNLIRGFFALLPGGEATYNRLAETGRIDALVSRIEGAMESLGITWDGVVKLFTDIWDAVKIEDLIDPIGTFERIRAQFGEPIERLIAFVATVVKEMLSLLLAAMNFPSDLVERIIANAMAAYADIRADPLRFLENMLAAVKRGFTLFFDHIADHLLRGLTDWLFGTLRKAGIQPPTALTLESILDFVLQVLGVTIEQLWTKLGQRIGQDNVAKLRRAVNTLTGVWKFIKDVQERGVAAIWEYIESQISNLWEMVLGQIKDWIMEQVINKVIAKLLSMLDPTGIMAVVNSFIAFFNAIQSVIEYARELLEIVDKYVSTIAAIARGDVEPGAAKLEEGLGAAVPVAIGFLANQVGLGDLAGRISEIVAGLRALVDQALDWLMDKCVAAGNAVLAAFGVGGEPQQEPVDPKDHHAFAQHAATRLKNDVAQAGAGAMADPATALTTVQQAASKLEPELSGQLENGIGLKFLFPGGERDAEDGEIRLAVVVAPNTEHLDTTLKIPGKGHAHDAANQLLIGRVGPFSSLKDLQDPRSTATPELRLYREHVIPRDAVANLGRGLMGPGAPRQSAAYESMITVLLYMSGKAAKDAADPGAHEVESRITAARNAATGTTENAKRLQMYDALIGYVDELRSKGASDAYAAAVADNSGSGGTARGTSGDPQPPAASINDAAEQQAGQVKDILNDATELGMVERDWPEDALAIANAISNKYKGGAPNTHADFATDIPLGAMGGTGTGKAILTITEEGWTLQARGNVPPRTLVVNAASAIGAIGAAIEQLRAEGATPRVFTPAYRARVVDKYSELKLKPPGRTQAAIAADVLGQLPEPEGRTEPPAVDTIIGWARDAGVA